MYRMETIIHLKKTGMTLETSSRRKLVIFYIFQCTKVKYKYDKVPAKVAEEKLLVDLIYHIII